MLNMVVLQGRLVADPEYRQTPQGTPTSRVRIAVERSFVRQGEQRQSDFFDITMWNKQAENVCKYFHKGDMILINGRIQTRTYQDKETGKNRTAFDIVAENFNFCGGRNGGGNGFAAVRFDKQCFPLRNSGGDLLNDLHGVFGSGVVAGQNDMIRQFCGNFAHAGTFGAVTVAARTENDGEFIPADFAENVKHVAQRIVRMGVIHIEVRPVSRGEFL